MLMAFSVSRKSQWTCLPNLSTHTLEVGKEEQEEEEEEEEKRSFDTGQSQGNNWATVVESVKV